jgi:hypothetical protein
MHPLQIDTVVFVHFTHPLSITSGFTSSGFTASSFVSSVFTGWCFTSLFTSFTFDSDNIIHYKNIKLNFYKNNLIKILKISKQLFITKMSSKDYEKTIKMLKKLPMYKQLKTENKELIERIRSLEYAVQYLESKNAKLEKKLNKKPIMKSVKIETPYVIDLTGDEDLPDEIIIEEEIKKNALDELLTKYPSYQNHKNIAASNVEVLEEEEVSDEDQVVIEIEEVVNDEVVVEEEEEEEVVEEEVVEEEVVEEEVVEEEEEEEVVEEEVVEEEVEEEEVVEEEVVEEEVVEEEVVEEEVVEEEVVEEEVVEEEVVEEEVVEEEVVEEEVVEEEVVEEEVVEEEVVEEEGEQEEEDVYEIEINGKTYYVMNEIDSIIYEADEEGEITIDAGIYKNGAPTFY